MNVRVMRRLGRTAQERLRDARRDDGVAMVIVLLMIMVILGLTVTLVSTLVATPPAIYLAERGTKTIYAAQAGLQAAVGQLRNTPTTSSAPGTPLANPADLPCTVSGTVDGSSSYSVTIKYYNSNPAGKTVSWLASRSNIASTRCAIGTKAPAFALIQSSGIGAAVPALASTAGVRTLQAIYGFNLSNVNIPGGPIYDISQGFCVTATSASVGSLVTYVPVVSGSGLTDDQKCPKATLMKWVYNSSYQLQLASTVGTSTQLCISGDTTNPKKNKPPITANVELQVCAYTNLQQWVWTGSYTWQQGTENGYCLGSSSTVRSGTTVQVLASGCSGTYYPSAAVGPGAASAATYQIVNFLEFGRCTDVTNQQITDTPYIVYPCKQDPVSRTGFTWNQKWSYTEPPAGATILANQQITTNPSGTPLCLTTTANSAVVPQYPTNYVYFTSCSSGAPNQKWTRVGNTGEFTSSYLLEDGWGHCLDLDQTHLYRGWSTVVVAACNGQNSQKWNAVAANTSGALGSYQEIG
ncbi:MAG: RICIN domain-containing protein [Acidobacteria bacterium]|nr:RICIN domain-containing protein [Acidobacteriota bacterium]